MRFEVERKGTILFRCDGTKETGLGHISRCLALAEAFHEYGFNTVFFGRLEAGAAALLNQSQSYAIESREMAGTEEDLRDTIRTVGRYEAMGLVVDSYRVDDRYIAQLNMQAASTLVIDDFRRLGHYECSALLNFTVEAMKLGYPCEDKLCLLGPNFFLARRRLMNLRNENRLYRQPVEHILVAMGGVDIHNLTWEMVRSLLRINRDLAVHVVVGESYSDKDRLTSLMSGFRGESHIKVQIADLAEEFVWADVCICGGGLTKYEAAYMGIPAGVYSQNVDQATETSHFAERGLAIDLGSLGTQSNAGLETRLSGLLADKNLRTFLGGNGLGIFPKNSTQNAARAFLRLLELR